MAKRNQRFKEEYSKLNKAQREAVDSIDGPVMVVAGPGTGKTQVLALRIANILDKTDSGAHSILCLTFTNSGVRAMRERLHEYIGEEASKVHISTFHSFATNIIEQYFNVLGLSEMPKLMDEIDSVSIYDEILNSNEWAYIRPRADVSRYFHDLKSLISLLKRERMDSKSFEDLILKEIQSLKSDPEHVSSRGATKGELKKDIQKRVEGLERTLEAVKFFDFYEDEKKERNLFDYDDVLENLVKVVENSEDALFDLREKYQYVLIDEHQDSSGVQNEFLEKVWKGEEKPNIFVVGDDRQLIYGFSGASLSYFENFKNLFGKAKLITLYDNYRSTQRILDLSHSLLESSLTEGGLKSNTKHDHPVRLVEASYQRDEIIACGIEIKDRIKNKEDINEMAVLVPKNRHVRSALLILKDMGIPVAEGDKINFFDVEEAQGILQVLKIVASGGGDPSFFESFFNKLSKVPPLLAHKFLRENNLKQFSLLDFSLPDQNLFMEEDPVHAWIKKLRSYIEDSALLDVYSLIQKIGSELLLDTAENHESLIRRVEIVRTLLHLALMQTEKNTRVTLVEFLKFIDRLESYGEHIPLAVFSGDVGVRVLTLHGSKGLEFDYVWIAHLDEKSLVGGKHSNFTLPDTLEDKIEKRNEKVIKRELFVAITRAKRFCTLSYSLYSYTGAQLALANVVSLLSDHFEKQTSDETENIILKHDPKIYVEKKHIERTHTKLSELEKMVSRDYEDRKVSVSLLNNFFECPWKWYFRNLLQLPEEKSASLEFGNKVHLAIDKILKLGRVPTKEELETIVNGEKEVFTIASRWVKDRLPNIAQRRENEKSISLSADEFPNLTIYGKLDLIEFLPNSSDKLSSVRVTDFKTGSVRKKSEIEKINDEGRMSNYMRQLAMYSFLIERNPKWKLNASESRLEFLEALPAPGGRAGKNEKESIYDTVIGKDKIDLLVQDIKDYNDLVKTGGWTSMSCKYNSYGKNTECPYCRLSMIYK